MFYDPPQKWTEELLDELPFGEDDRYERKSGDEISKNKFDDFFNKLAKEVGAFANSFGGTLFIGIADDKTKIGVPAIAKGNTPTERWLENKLPALFELRLQHFRISRVELTDKTQHQIGNNRIIIAIDVFNSELAPHQCVRDHTYYYRSNSESKPAPHHYLAFLWGRANSNMSQVATWWIKDFLSPVITLLDQIQRDFNRAEFTLVPINTEVRGSAFVRRIEFFNKKIWDGLISSSVGEYFLSAFPLISEELFSFEKRMDDFKNTLSQLEKSVEESPILLRHLKDVYERLISRERISRSQFEHYDLRQMAQCLLGQLHLEMALSPDVSTVNLVRFTAFSLLELALVLQGLTITEEQNLWNLCKDIAEVLRNEDERIFKSLEEPKRLLESLKSESLGLWERLRKDRIEIATRYTATYGQ